MDIAKIRKKLKEAGSDTGGKGEVGSPEVRTPGYELKAKDTKIEKIDTEIKEETDVIEILTFSLWKEEFAFRVSQLEEILRPQQITMVPKMPKYVMGITSLRGKIIPVIDLKTKLSFTDKPSDISNAMKILIIKGPNGPIGAVVDKVIGVVRIAKSDIIPPPSHLTETELKFIEGVTMLDKRFISIIQMEEAIKIEQS